MDNQVFNKYKNIFEERCDKIKLLDVGEDSVRYDFFIALSEIEKLRPSDIQLEYSIHKSAFKARLNANSKRKEKPQIDLVVETAKHKLNFEFALFRQNSNEEGSINKTARTVKMLNDMIRLALDSQFTKRESYFICVADDKMLGHQLQSKLLGKFPSDYEINKGLIKKQKEKKTSDFDDRFLTVFNELDLKIKTKIVFNQKVEAKMINRETRIIIWNVKTE
ncbi:hypothetical protein BH09BAC5_BH09BAC5_18950 [soil metagenome]